MTTHTISYMEARALRIRRAIERYDDSWESIAIEKNALLAQKFLFFALSVLTIAPLLIVWSGFAGFLGFATGAIFLFFSTYEFWSISRESDELLRQCFATLDREDPTLLAMMNKKKYEGVQEEWSSSTF